jgi:hypothetical protein
MVMPAAKREAVAHLRSGIFRSGPIHNAFIGYGNQAFIFCVTSECYARVTWSEFNLWNIVASIINMRESAPV